MGLLDSIIRIDNEVDAQATLIAQIEAALEGKAAGGGGIVPTGTIQITENGTHDVTNYASAEVNVPDTPAVVYPLTVTENGTYTAPDGVDGYSTVTVNVEGSAGEEMAMLLMNTLTVLDNSVATSLRTRACQYATNLVTVNLPNVTTLDTYVFYGCTALTTVHLPLAKSIPTQAFYNCSKLKHADFGNAGSIAAQAFNACAVLTELILRKTDAICALANTNAISNSAIGKGTGYIYVPAVLIEEYKVATNWVTYADQFRAIEDYPEITGG